jgi:hypothetical protein
MIKAGLRVLVVACLTSALPLAAKAGGEAGKSIEIEKPAAAPAESDAGYRPPWADPNAKPPQPGIENDPTPFNPSDVDQNTDTLSNHNLDE